jgi:hypothetical protein
MGANSTVASSCPFLKEKNLNMPGRHRIILKFSRGTGTGIKHK